MDGTRTRRRGLRRAAIATVAGIAFAGATLIGATSATASGTDSSGCLATSSNSALASGLASGLLDCITSGGPATPTTAATGTPTTPAAAAPTPPSAPASPVEVPVSSTTTPTPAPAEPVTTTPETTKTPAVPGALRMVQVITTTNTVYPSATGYSKSTVRFSIRGLTAASAGVRITGSAVLRKGAQVVQTWPIGNATTTLSWDGRNGSKVDPGRYVLTATAWSSDGSRATSTMRVRVSAKHLVTRTVSMRTKDLAKVRSNALPVAVMQAFDYGRVTFRIHTVAKVTGAARLVIIGPYGDRLSMPLLDGTHVTRPAVLSRTFTSAAFHHEWTPGAAKLVELYTVFTYKQLV